MTRHTHSAGRDDKSPFQVLREYERLSLAHAVGLPEQVELPGQWSGIGFGLGEQKLVASIGLIREILPFPKLTQVPGSSEWLLGIANVRGTLAAVIDLRGFLDGEPTTLTPRSRLLLISQGSGAVALLVDEVMGLRRFMDDEIASEAEFDETSIGPFIQREYVQDDARWGVFDLDELLARPDFVQAAA